MQVQSWFLKESRGCWISPWISSPVLLHTLILAGWSETSSVLGLCQGWAPEMRVRHHALYFSSCCVSAAATVLPEKHIFLFKSSAFEDFFQGWHFEPHFRTPVLEATSHSARRAAWAQKTSVPSSDKPAGVRDSVWSKPGWWRGCRLFMEAPWSPWISPSLMKDCFFSMTVLGPLVIDLRGLRTTTNSSIALGILTHF